MLRSRLKELTVGRDVGRFAQRVRQSWQILSADLEELGWHANDQLAEHYVTRLCLPGKVFVDGGAHIGSITAAVLRNCVGADVVAVEAIPEKAARLAKNFTTVRVESCALAEQTGQATFYVDLGNTAWSSLAVNERKVREIIVECCRLDDINVNGVVDVLKLDLEGAELGALRGGENLVKQDRPIIMFESGPTEYMGYSKSEMFDWLSARDYQIYLPSRLGKEAPAMSKEVFERLPLLSVWYTQLFRGTC